MPGTLIGSSDPAITPDSPAPITATSTRLAVFTLVRAQNLLP